MKEPPDAETLKRIADGLDDPVEDLVRKDSQFKKLELNEEDYVGDASAVIDLLSQKKSFNSETNPCSRRPFKRSESHCLYRKAKRKNL